MKPVTPEFFIPRPHQEYMIDHILFNDAVQECGGASLFTGLGTGKTSASLIAINRFIEDGYSGAILIIGPLKVVKHTWPAEIAKWQQTQDITYSVVTGSIREKEKALRKKADVYLINQESVSWLVGYLRGHWKFKIVFVDEFSAFKNRTSNRTHALTQMRPQMHQIIGLTGTPAPNGLHDLWAPMKLLDKGRRLGEKIGDFRRNFLVPDKYNKGKVTKYKVRGAESKVYGTNIYEKIIYDKIGDICISMRTEDYIQLPPMVQSQIDVPFSPKLMKMYEEFERDAVLEYLDKEITAVNAAALRGKLIQFCNGAVYLKPKEPEFLEFHNEKIDALKDVLEDLSGSPLLCWINYQHDFIRIQKYLGKFKPKKLITNDDFDAWNRGEIEFACMHPKSGGHGLNLQFGGNNILWFGYTDSLELWQQANGRIHRPGIDRGVFVNTLAVPGTVEDLMRANIDAKEKGQSRLLAGTKAIIDKYR